MLNPSVRPPRPRLTGPIFLYALVDMFGLACVGIGASWFAAGKGAILTGFPTSNVEAVACTAGGVAIMIWAVARILRELTKQAPEMQAKFDNYLGKQATGQAEKSPDDKAD
ncbi:MAG: hypothetical protein H6R14_984 [Proteobacteria bacterium]|nr:hypothetical protein [Pseudomonadota bacterium]